jgi:hypothetical protein
MQQKLGYMNIRRDRFHVERIPNGASIAAAH